MSPPHGAALVVAGGAGERMRRSGGNQPKPLMTVGGTSLLERNVMALIDNGFTNLHVAASAQHRDVVEAAEGPCRRVADAAGAHLHVIVESEPLGSLGAVALIETPGDVLVVNADNLTSLDLAAVADDHRRARAAMTVAVHEEPFAMPFGEITTDGSRIVTYREKPTYRILVSSAVTVVGTDARRLIEPGDHVMLPELANRVLELGLPIHAHHHRSPWIDVNDMAALRRAESMFEAAP